MFSLGYEEIPLQVSDSTKNTPWNDIFKPKPPFVRLEIKNKKFRCTVVMCIVWTNLKKKIKLQEIFNLPENDFAGFGVLYFCGQTS